MNEPHCARHRPDDGGAEVRDCPGAGIRVRRRFGRRHGRLSIILESSKRSGLAFSLWPVGSCILIFVTIYHSARRRGCPLQLFVLHLRKKQGTPSLSRIFSQFTLLNETKTIHHEILLYNSVRCCAMGCFKHGCGGLCPVSFLCTTTA